MAVVLVFGFIMIVMIVAAMIFTFATIIIGPSVIRKVRQAQYITNISDIITIDNLNRHIEIIQISRLCTPHAQGQGGKGKAGSHQSGFHIRHYIYSYIRFY